MSESQPLDPSLLASIRVHAHPLTGGPADHDPLMAMVGKARYVLLGAATHGTREFQLERARITRRLIEEKGFSAVALAGDWPDAWRVNRYVRGAGTDRNASQALEDFRHFPTRMWRNADVLEFIDWLKDHNETTPAHAKVGVYGLDLYSLHASMQAVLAYLERADPATAAAVRQRCARFDHFGGEEQVQGLLAGLGASRHREDVIVGHLSGMRCPRRPRGDCAGWEGFLQASQEGRLSMTAESYDRLMFRDDVSSWSLRDLHMADTLSQISMHLARGRDAGAKIVVWAHNAHVGDARACEIGWRRQELSLGQILRERHGEETVLVGMTTHRGTVESASGWGARPERKTVPTAHAASHEHLFHATGLGKFTLALRNRLNVAAFLMPRLERSVGVVQEPGIGRQDHGFLSSIADRFDAVLHIDVTNAVEPLEPAGWPPNKDSRCALPSELQACTHHA